jgi:hypothetical protein
MNKKTVGTKEGLAFGIIALGVLLGLMPSTSQQIADILAGEAYPILLGATYVLAVLVVLAGVAVLVAKFDDNDEEE